MPSFDSGGRRSTGRQHSMARLGAAAAPPAVEGRPSYSAFASLAQDRRFLAAAIPLDCVAGAALARRRGFSPPAGQSPIAARETAGLMRIVSPSSDTSAPCSVIRTPSTSRVTCPSRRSTRGAPLTPTIVNARIPSASGGGRPRA